MTIFVCFDWRSSVDLQTTNTCSKHVTSTLDLDRRSENIYATLLTVEGMQATVHFILMHLCLYLYRNITVSINKLDLSK